MAASEVRVVAREWPASVQVAAHAAALRQPVDRVGHLEREGVRAVTVAGGEKTLAGLRGLERRHEQKRRERRPRVAQAAEERVLQLLG